MRARIDRLEREMRAAISDVHRQYRRELVLYRPPTELVPTEGSEVATDGLQQAHDQEHRRRSLPRRSLRAALGNPELYPEHLLLALLDQELPRQLVVGRAALRAQAEATLAAEPRIAGRAAAAAGRRAFSRVLDER